MIQFGILFATQILEALLIIVLLIKLQGMKKQVEHIIKEVKGYIAFITEDADNEWEAEASGINRSVEVEKIRSSEQRKGNRNEKKENIQSQLIQDVLQEYFP